MSKNTKMNHENSEEKEDPPEYRVLTQENMYEFIIWSNELKPPSIEVNQFNMMLQSNVQDWIYENNITWQFAYTNTLDTILGQTNIEKKFDEKSYTEKIRPTSTEERRKLFSQKAEERMNGRLKKNKSHRKTTNQ